MTERQPVTYRSVSQLKEFTECGHRYKLARRDRAWKRPAAWFPHGTAVHKAAEEWEKSERTMTLEAAQAAFQEAYVAEVNGYLEGTPNANEWFSSGPYRGEADIARRFGKGLEQVASYIEYYRANPEETVWETPDGPAIELEFKVDIGGVEVFGYIDQVVWVKPVIPKPKSRAKAAVAAYEQAVADATPELRVRDIKTGQNPGDAFQLKVYALAVESLYGVEITAGDYWMAKKGGPTKAFDLTTITRDEVAQAFAAADEGILAERFDPKPGPACERCSVATACEFRLR